MLQDITIDDINNVHRSLNKNNLLIVYNELKECQEELGLTNFYFDDNFYWTKQALNVSKEIRASMDNGSEIYGITFSLPSFKQGNKTDKWYLFLKKLQKKYNTSWSKSSYSVYHYFDIILNKMRPTEEYYQILLEEKRKREDEQESELNAITTSRFNKNKTVFKKQVNKNKNKHKGYVYGIKIDNKLVYIGKTIRPIQDRISEHIECVLDETIENSQQKYLYKAMRECQGYKFEIMAVHEEIDNHSLEMIEKALIENMKPEFNYEGVKVPYRFSGS